MLGLLHHRTCPPCSPAHADLAACSRTTKPSSYSGRRQRHCSLDAVQPLQTQPAARSWRAAAHSRMQAHAATDVAGQSVAEPAAAPQRTQICTIVTAASMSDAMRECAEAATSGADIVELRLDFLDAFDPQKDLPPLLAACSLPCIVTCRPDWEGCAAVATDE